MEFHNAWNEIIEEEAEKARAKAMIEGQAKGRAEGRAEEQKKAVLSIMETLGITMDQAMKALKLSSDDQAQIRRSLES